MDRRETHEQLQNKSHVKILSAEISENPDLNVEIQTLISEFLYFPQ